MMFHAAIAEHSIPCLAPRTEEPRTFGKLVERLPKILVASVASVDLSHFAALFRYRCDARKRRNAIGVPSVALGTEGAKQARCQGGSRTAEFGKGMCVGMLLHLIGNLCFKVLNHFLRLLYETRKKLRFHCRRSEHCIKVSLPSTNAVRVVTPAPIKSRSPSITTSSKVLRIEYFEGFKDSSLGAIHRRV